ncbi:MAG TPA: YcxB family protein [Saprospiraceae bacterium]|nr:YcxB family protein [Saprospiraceae bacterium]HMP25392.1 YcxB family protein [Saprospiraceae bacterium]
MIEARYQISFQDYLRLMFQIAYRRWTYIVITMLGAVQLPLIAAMFIFPELYDPNRLTSAFLLIVFAFMMPLLLYFRTRTYYFGNISFQQEIRATFSKDLIEFSGLKRNASLSWDRIQQVVETKDWFIFYQTRYFFNFAPKNAFRSEADLGKLRKMVRSKSHVRARLRG